MPKRLLLIDGSNARSEAARKRWQNPVEREKLRKALSEGQMGDDPGRLERAALYLRARSA